MEWRSLKQVKPYLSKYPVYTVLSVIHICKAYNLQDYFYFNLVGVILKFNSEVQYSTIPQQKTPAKCYDKRRLANIHNHTPLQLPWHKQLYTALRPYQLPIMLQLAASHFYLIVHTLQGCLKSIANQLPYLGYCRL